MARVMELDIGDFDAQDLANTAWAHAAAGQSDAPMLAALASAALQHFSDFSATSKKDNLKIAGQRAT